MWTHEVDTAEGVFRLSNEVKVEAVRYIWITGKKVENLVDPSVSVDVRVSRRSHSTSSAGLIYRWTGDPKRYYAFLLSGDGTYTFGVRRSFSPGLFHPLTERSDKIRTDGWNNMGIVGRGDKLDLHINGSMVRTVDAPDLSDGYVGVIATGTGVFEFDNFGISQ